MIITIYSIVYIFYPIVHNIIMIWNRLRVPLIIFIVIAALLTSLCLTTFIDARTTTHNSLKFTKIGGYTTYFQDSTADRKENIRLAATALNNIAVAPGETISFNTLVGARTTERGFRSALIISQGEYVMGIGGGVCQVSTTVYNAWITSGLEAVEVHAHSRPSHYVPLSRDAMISATTDMLLRNNQTTPILITSIITDSSLVIKIYGDQPEYDYNVLSIKVGEVDTPTPIISYIYDIERAGGQEIAFAGAKGYMSRAVMQRLKNGAVIDETEIRRDYYLPIAPKINIFTNTDIILPTT